MSLDNLTAACLSCKHRHYVNVGFTCTRFMCDCTAVAAVPEVVVDKSTMSVERAPWRGLHRGDRAVIEARSGTKYVPLSLRPLEGMQVIVAGYVAFRVGICTVRAGQPHYHVVLPDDIGHGVVTAPFICISAGLIRPLRAEEVSIPTTMPETREPEVITRGRRGALE